MATQERSLLPEVLGEIAGTSLLVGVAFASGSVHAQLGMGSLGAALLGSIALGLGHGLVIWHVGGASGAQLSPVVSIVASLLGGQRWLRTLARIAAQLLGAIATALAVAAVAPPTFVSGTPPTASPVLAEGLAAFGFILVALGVAPRRNAKVPLSLGAFATASFWMTGRATVGNPVLAASVLLVSQDYSPSRALFLASSAVFAGVLAAAAARFLFPQAREAANQLLYVPKGRR